MAALASTVMTAITEETVLVSTVKGVDIVVEGHGQVNTGKASALAHFNRALLTDARAAYDRGEAPWNMWWWNYRRTGDFAPPFDTKIKKGLEYGNTPLARAPT